jgi:hypothetical protein
MGKNASVTCGEEWVRVRSEETKDEKVRCGKECDCDIWERMGEREKKDAPQEYTSAS